MLVDSQDTRQPPETVERKGIFARVMAGSTIKPVEKKTVMTNATYLKAHRAEGSTNNTLHAICDCRGLPRGMLVTAGQVTDAPH